jgi:hypothetical protein
MQRWGETVSYPSSSYEEAYEVQTENLYGNRLLGRCRYELEDNIKMVLTIVCEVGLLEHYSLLGYGVVRSDIS